MTDWQLNLWFWEWYEEIETGNNLRDIYLEPPFSVLDTRQKSWIDRQKKWMDLWIKSELWRKDRLIRTMPSNWYDTKNRTWWTSVFDPSLTEVIYTWYTSNKWKVLDIFAGGSVRWIIASYMWLEYHWIELREEQVLSNQEQVNEILNKDKHILPKYLIWDSEAKLDEIQDDYFDLIFTCPPYVDLEVYSDDENDLSNMDYNNFIQKYERIIKKSITKVKKDWFVIFVVWEVRDKQWYYYNFVWETKNIMLRNWLKFYNDAILLNRVGSASLRANTIFWRNKKLVKLHQNILIFKKVD